MTNEKKLCIRFHMPEIIYSGWAKKIIREIEDLGDIKPITTGPMGNTALLDTDLDQEIRFIDSRLNEWLKRENSFDYYINAISTSNLNKAKADCWHIDKLTTKPVIGVEPINNKVMCFKENKVAKKISKNLDFKLKKINKFNETYWEEGAKKHRRVLAVNKGDFLLINGLNLGKVISNDVLITKEKDKVNIKGIKTKEESLSKLKNFSLKKAKIASTDSFKLNKGKKNHYEKGNKIFLINHEAFKSYKIIKNGIKGAITIGDDTTYITGNIFNRFSLPIIGITDNDRDYLLNKTNLTNGSLVLTVKKDDSFGEIIKQKIFKNSDHVKDISFSQMKKEIIKIAKERDFLIKKKEF